MRSPNDISTFYYIDIVDSCGEHVFELEQEDTIQMALTYKLDKENLRRPTSTIQLSLDLEIIVAFLDSLSKMLQRYNPGFISLPINPKKLSSLL